MPINQVRLISTLIVAFVMLSGAWSLHSVVSPDGVHDYTRQVGTLTTSQCRTNAALQTASCIRR